MIKRILTFFLSLLTCCNCDAQVHVDGYYRSNGTYVEPHYRSSPDGDPYNNYSYSGNYNPYTGKVAGGSEEAYLANYYKTYSSHNITASTIANYNHNLLNVNYWGVNKYSEVKLKGSDGIITGFARQDDMQRNRFNLYDIDDVPIGSVTFRINSYVMRDSYGMRLYSVNRAGYIQPDNTAGTIYGVGALGLLVTLLIIAL